MMGHRCCSKQKVKRGLWSPEEDEKLIRYITTHGHGSWSSVPKFAGLQRCGKSCRLRWINYLRPELKRGSFSAQEEQIIIDVHRILGNRWAQIAKHLPGRTDNEVKNFWNSCIKKKLISQGLDPKTHNLISSHQRNMMISSSNYKLPVSTASQQQQQPFSLSVLMSSTDVNHHHHHHHQDQHITLLNQNPDLPHPPFVTLPLPSLPPTSGQQHQALPDYQNPNPLWTTITTLPSGSSLIGIPPPVISSSVNPFGFGFSDDNSNSTWINPVEHLEAPTPEQMQTHDQHHQVQQMNKNVININISEMENINDHEEKFSGQGDHNIDVSFDSSSFDLELIQSTLLSGAICRDLTAMDDLAWNF